MSKPSLMLGIRVRPEQREALGEFLRRAIPHYEALGGVRIRLLQSARDEREYIEVVEFADQSVYEREMARAESEPEMLELLREWRTHLDAGPTVETFMDRTPSVTPPPPELPVLRTARLTLRAFRMHDLNRVVELVGDRRVAAMTLTVPHPYSEADARAWFATIREAARDDRARTYAIERHDTHGEGVLIGCVGLMINRAHKRAELGYWIGVEFWNQGIATEAALALVGHGFDELGLERIHASHFGSNGASGRVMEKLGMRREGTLPRHVLRFDEWHDSILWGISREMWRVRVPTKAAHA